MLGSTTPPVTEAPDTAGEPSPTEAGAEADPAPQPRAPSALWPWIRRGGLVLYGVFTAWLLYHPWFPFRALQVFGVGRGKPAPSYAKGLVFPSQREIWIVWLVGLVLVSCLGRSRRDALSVVIAWTPFLLALFLYDFARGLHYWLYNCNDQARGQCRVFITPQIRADRILGFGKLPTERLQRWLIDPSTGFFDAPRFDDPGLQTWLSQTKSILTRPRNIRWYDVMVAAVYQSHFVVPYGMAGALWRRARNADANDRGGIRGLWTRAPQRWRWYATSFVAITFGSCAIFTLWATAPPWYAAQQGRIAIFPRVLAGRGWYRLHINFAAQAIEKGGRAVNPFAAIPSLHSAEALLVAVFAWRIIWKWLRPLLVMYPLVMAFALVYSGEHYLIDVFVGWGMVALVLTAGWRLRLRYGWGSPFLRRS